MIEGYDWRWPNFTPKEMTCKHCNALIIVDDFMDRLQRLRIAFKKPIVVNSAYRCSKHNAAVSSTGPTGPHTTGRAVDIKVNGQDAYDLVKLALSLGFTGVGISQKGDWGSRFVHLDDIPDNETRPRIWSY